MTTTKERRHLTRERREVSTRFAHNLSQAIDDEGLTNMEVAVRSGMTATEVSYYRNGRRIPSVNKAADLARAVGRSLDELAYTLTPEERAAAVLEESLRGLREEEASARRRSRGRKPRDSK